MFWFQNEIVPGSEVLAGRTKFISETLIEKMLIFKIKFKNVGFVNICTLTVCVRLDLIYVFVYNAATRMGCMRTLTGYVRTHPILIANCVNPK